MSEEERTAADPAPVVAGIGNQNGGGVEEIQEEEMGDVESELSELEEVEGEIRRAQKDTGRPNFPRAKPNERAPESTQEFFRRGKAKRAGAPIENSSSDELDSGDELFAPAAKGTMRGALARSLSAAATSSPHQVGMALTLKNAKAAEKVVEAEGSEGVLGMDVAAADGKGEMVAMDWAEEAPNQTEEEEGRGDVADLDRRATPSPTPARWSTQTPRAVPATPSNGNKKRALAVGTPRPPRAVLPPRRQVGIPSQGWTSGAALGEVMASIAAAEAQLAYRMEERVAALEQKMMEGMAALSEDAEGRLRRSLADAEEREKRVTVKLLATEGIESELLQRAQCENGRWEELGERLRDRKREIGAIKKVVDGLALQLGDGGVSRPAPSAAAPAQRAPAPRPSAAPPRAVAPVIPREAKEPRGSPHQQRRQAAMDEAAARRTGKSGRDREGIEEKRGKAKAFFRRGTGETPALTDASTAEEVDTAAMALREVMTATLNKFAKQKRSCARSKRWWTEDLGKLRKEMGRARRNWRVAGMSRVQAARRELRRAIRKAKRDCWNKFLQEAKGTDIWTAAAYTSPRIDKAGQALVAEDGSVAEGRRDREQALLGAHFPQGPPGTYEPREGGKAFERVDTQLVAAMLSKAANTSAPGDDRISAGIIKVFWEWDSERITQIVRACIRLGHHPELWKTAKGVVIPKPGKPDYAKVRAYRVISLLDVISKLLERTAAHLIADYLERSRGLHEGQFGCRKRRSCVDAVAILMNRTQKAWAERKVAGALFMDVKSAFNNVSKAFLGRRMEELGLEADLIRWTMSFMSGRQVKLALDGEVGEAHAVDTGVPQGSPAAPILFVTYLSGIFDEVEPKIPGVSGLSFVDDIGWWVDGKDDEGVAVKLSEAATAAMEWAGQNGVAFDHGKTEAALFWRKRKMHEAKAKVKVGDNEVPFNKEATRWLGVWLDSQLTLKEHHATRLKNGRNALTRLRRLTGQLGLSPANCRKVMTACIQSAAMFGAELWWKGEGARGTVGRANDLQLLINQQAWATTGAFRTTNLGALSMESGLRPAGNQLENRQRRFGLRLLSLPRGEMARRVVNADTPIGRRLATALGYT